MTRTPVQLARGPRTDEVMDRLSSVQWDFDDGEVRDPVHGIHPYPAKFVPRVPSSLIEMFPPRGGTAVFDPFCGSGTTLVEAQRLGHPSVGLDLHPLACLMSQVKTTPLPQPIRPIAQELVEKARASAVDIPDIPRLDHWFLDEVQEVLASLTHLVEQIDPPAVRHALQVALSRIIVRVSNQESDTRYAAIEKDVNRDIVLKHFIDSARVVDRALLGRTHPDDASARIVNDNVLTVQPDTIADHDGIGLVVTSPPYPNAYEYWLYHKYRMYWLGMDPIHVRTHEIGARPHYFKKDPHTPDDFRRQMETCFGLFREVARKDALVCFLVGRSIIRGEYVDNAALLVRAAQRRGYVPVGQATRSIPRGRKTFNPDHGAIEEERLVVFATEETTS